MSPQNGERSVHTAMEGVEGHQGEHEARHHLLNVGPTRGCMVMHGPRRADLTHGLFKIHSIGELNV